MACDPTLSTCDTLCQTLITNVIAQCKNICLPDGYFFDPSKQYSLKVENLAIFDFSKIF